MVKASKEPLKRCHLGQRTTYITMCYGKFMANEAQADWHEKARACWAWRRYDRIEPIARHRINKLSCTGDLCRLHTPLTKGTAVMCFVSVAVTCITDIHPNRQHATPNNYSTGITKQKVCSVMCADATYRASTACLTFVPRH